MSIKSLGYIGVNATTLSQWKGFACDVMGLEDVSSTLGDDKTHYYKMDDHPYRVFVQAAEADGLAVCGWETNNQNGLDGCGSRLSPRQASPLLGVTTPLLQSAAYRTF
jgi:3,4-dihydroxy-9,10-secoandrosta-1,3,5(10)-triene-9,17-dione 4,5-dioxygenase